MSEHPGPMQDRYHRQALLAEIGAEGQGRLGESHALIVGCGALGTVCAEMLARAGVGRLTIVDRDTVELTNLQRQVLFDEADARERVPKAAAAAARLGRINAQVRVRGVIADFSWRNAEAIVLSSAREDEGALGRADVILDATDNFETRYLINDLAVKHGIPWVYGAAVGTEGMTMTCLPGGAGPCLRCVFEEPPGAGSSAASATCDTVGVLGPVVAIIANLQAVEAIKLLSGRVGAASRALTSIDPWCGGWRSLDVSGARREECPCCGRRSFDFLEGRRSAPAAAMCGRDSVQVSPVIAEGGAAPRVDLAALAARLSSQGSFTATRFLVRGVLSSERGDSGGPIELTVFADGRAIVSGTTRPELARTVYARYVGA